MLNEVPVTPVISREIPAELQTVPIIPGNGNQDRLWSIVLAGGRGERIGSFVRRWRGRPIPKQYCAFVGTRSMLQHTLDRAASLGERDHQFTVIDRSHQTDALDQLADRPRDSVILQPANRDTFPGIYLPLTYVYARNTSGTVTIHPSDHFVYPESEFLAWMAKAVEAVEEIPDRLVLVGVPATGPEPDYGWIVPGCELWRRGKYSLRGINSFLEKPSPAAAGLLPESGCLWNTMIVIAKTRTLWQLGWKFFPDTMRLFARLKDAIGTSREEDVLREIYEIMPVHNFSSDLLAHAAGSTAVMPMAEILWSDWGRAERIAETLRSIGKSPNFPETILEVQ
jgi:mannose-1-phosphate guanylyltransferase